jgi:hypothetical protein
VADDVINVIGRNLVGSTLGSTIGSGLSSVTGYKTPAEKFAQQQTPTTLQTPVIDYAGVEPIDVLAKRLASGSGSPFASAFPVPVNAMLSGALSTTQPAQQNKTAEDIEAERNPMVVTADRPYLSPEALAAIMATFGGGALAATQPTLTQQAKTAEDIEAAKNPINVTGGGLESLTPEELLAALGGVGGLAAATAGGGAGGTAAANDIVVTGSESLTPDELLATLGGAPTSLLPDNFFEPPSTDVNKKLGLEEYLRIAALASGLIGGGGGGSGSSGTYGGAGGTGRLNPIFSAKLPSAGGLGSIGMNRTQRPMGDVDWLTYGTRPELSFFDYAPRAALPTPVTTPVPSNPAGPIMNQNDPMRFAKGGRSEFAVNGAGTGRSDDIPAVLSDGEYVIDAETVALLGDGSNKAGAKKLDELRIKVRKHKGKKLAKGRFSANAKKPEAYLSGGRI